MRTPRVAMIMFAVTVLASLALGQNRWTTIPPGPELWVSHAGSDTAGDGTAAHPFATVPRAMAEATTGTDIHIGPGTWPAITSWVLSGTSSNPTVITSWPGEDRPVISGGFGIRNGQRVDYLWLVDLVLSGGQYPLDLLGSGVGIRVEGCLIQGGAGARVQGYPSTANRFTGTAFFRTCIADAPNANGLYVESADLFSFVESAIISVGGTGDTHHQGLYLHQTCTPALVSGSMFVWPSAGGLQQRIGGLAEDCFAYQCPIAFQMGHAETGAARASGTIRNCVVVDGADIGPADPRGFAFWFDNTASVISDGNIALNQVTGHQPVAFSLRNGARATIMSSLTLNWDDPGEPSVQVFDSSAVTLGTGNDFRFATRGANPGLAYPFPTRSLGQYAAEHSITPATDLGFFARVRANSKMNWNPALTAHAVNEWFRAGVGRAAMHCVADVSSDGAVTVEDVLQYLGEFEAGSFDADLGGVDGDSAPDGAVDINDLLRFLAAYENGC